MPESDRLEELRRQRALLDAEIERATRSADAPGADATAPKSSAARPPPSRVPTEISAQADDLIQRYADKPPPSPRELKTGCWGALVLLLLLIGAAFAAIHHVFYSDRPLF